MGVPLSYNLRNLRERKVTTFMTALGIGLTVAVLVASLAMAQGLTRMFAGSGNPLHLMVMRQGAESELISTVSEATYQTVRVLPGIARDEQGQPLVSPEGMTVVNLPSVDSDLGVNVTVRGILPVGLRLRPVEIVAGEMFKPGLRQVVVGTSIAKRFPDAQVGRQLRFGRGLWDVVGVFKSGESSANSEIWADLNQLRGDFESSGGSNILLIRAVDTDAMATLAKTIKDDQRLNSEGKPEKQYFADQARSSGMLITMGYAVAVIMAIGSSFAATNTMYATISRRTREIGTLRALGFSRFAILRSFLFESVMLALLGGLLGVLIALPVNGITTGVGTNNFSEVAFKLHVGAMPIAVGLIFAIVIGAVGGLLPAWSAARKNVVAAMREA
jgi:putative ABC transport system permease protein